MNHKRVHRVYREAGLALRQRKRKRCVPQSAPLRQCTAANQKWALDFAHDSVAAGRSIRVLSVFDAYTRECLVLEVDTICPSRRVTRVLDEIIAERGQPLSLPLMLRAGADFAALPRLGQRVEDRSSAYPAR